MAEDKQIIDISPEFFNPLFWILRHHMLDPAIRYIYIFGGASATKTYTVCQIYVLFVMELGWNILITRKYSSDMEDSIYADVKKIITELPEDGGFDFEDRFEILTKKITCKDNGAFIRFRGMDDSEKIHGISTFRILLMEEFFQYEMKDNKTARKRLRGIPNQKLMYIWNPIDELSWQKKKLLDKETWRDCSVFPNIDDSTGVKDSMIAEHKINDKGNAIYIRTNYMDNWYIVGHPKFPPNQENPNPEVNMDIHHGGFGYRDVHVIADMEEDKIEDPDTYRVFGEGHWGRVNRGGEFYKSFVEKRTLFTWGIGDLNEHLAFHVSIDENVNPYLSMTVYQASGKSSWLIDEFTMKNPSNTVSALAKEFATRFGAWTRMHVFIYGDATSVKEDTKMEKGENFYTLLRTELDGHGFKTTLRVPRQNPGQIARGQFINQVFSKHGFEDMDFRISSNCTETIQDLKYLKEAQDGKKFKEKTTDKETKVRYEIYGHLSDSMDYFLCTYYSAEFHKFQKGKWGQVVKVIERRPKSELSNHY